MDSDVLFSEMFLSDGEYRNYGSQLCTVGSKLVIDYACIDFLSMYGSSSLYYACAAFLSMYDSSSLY